MGDSRLNHEYDKFEYIHYSKNGKKIIVHYHKHYQTGKIIDLKIKRY